MNFDPKLTSQLVSTIVGIENSMFFISENVEIFVQMLLIMLELGAELLIWISY